MKFDIWVFFENLLRKLEIHYNLTRITGILHEDQYTFFIVSHTFLLRMRNVPDERCRENQNTHFIFNNRAVYEIMWKKNIVQPCRPLMTIWFMCIACWITKATDTHSEYVILTAFPLQTMVARTCHSVVSNVHCRPFFFDTGNEIVWILHNIICARAPSMEHRRCNNFYV